MTNFDSSNIQELTLEQVQEVNGGVVPFIIGVAVGIDIGLNIALIALTSE
ncbi:class IIb bacteriocin, lactobin A/cerein 7B family [Alteromonas sp. BL110]|jgi:lactobin A/cerein 7B family class IIb bacteriocin|nr:class IIb bacteriocin, lactobin A/cerein 7B family [Alteromonas sp. BL110]AXT38406.1 class IIb bacteriocin, lactobin A/cerein 7B family [Alteromonas sp. BL110]RKM83850.1 class IIb bacteriocin, lactobin A/cerein 7B family [Alteromonas sp. BL110]